MQNYEFIIISANEERKNTMIKQLEYFKIKNFYFLDASTIENSQEYLNIENKNDNYLKILCCARSHIRALKNASKSKYDFSIILEDDVAFHKNNFIKNVENLINNWDEYTNQFNSNLKLISIGWVPVNHYNYFENLFDNNSIALNKEFKLKNFIVSGLQGYIVKKTEIADIVDKLYKNTFTELSYTLKTIYNFDTARIDAVDRYLNRIMKQLIVFPPLMIEQDIKSLLGHANIQNYWDIFFKNYENVKLQYYMFEKINTNRVCILLTTYNIQDRQHIYKNIIGKWLKHTNFTIFVVDSSGNKIDIEHPKLHQFSFTQDAKYNGAVQPTNGEKNSIIKAVHFFDKKLLDYDMVFKITGKYFIPQFESVIQNMNISKDTDIVLQCLYCNKFKWQHSEIIGIKPSKILDLMNLIENKPFEMMLYERIKDDKFKIDRLPRFEIENNIKRNDGSILTYL